MTLCCSLPTAPARRLEGEAAARFEESAVGVCADLARAIAADAEGASHLIRIDVEWRSELRGSTANSENHRR